jgi:hypothetical protein
MAGVHHGMCELALNARFQLVDSIRGRHELKECIIIIIIIIQIFSNNHNKSKQIKIASVKTLRSA